MPIGYCEQYQTSIFTPVYFFVLDFGLSVFLMVLFIFPLHYHAKQMAKMGMNKRAAQDIYYVAKRNSVLSMVMIVSMTTSSTSKKYYLTLHSALRKI